MNASWFIISSVLIVLSILVMHDYKIDKMRIMAVNSKGAEWVCKDGDCCFRFIPKTGGGGGQCEEMEMGDGRDGR